MVDISETCSELGVRPELLERLSVQESRDLVRSSFRVLARQFHEDSTRDAETSRFVTLSDAYQTVLDPSFAGLRGELDFRLAHVRERALQAVRKAEADIALLGSTIAQLVAIGEDPRPAARNLPVGVFQTFDYFAGYQESGESGRNLAERADAARAALRSPGELNENDLYELHQTFWKPEHLGEVPILKGGILESEPEKQIVGFLYCEYLSDLLMPIARRAGVSVMGVSKNLSSESFRELLPIFRPVFCDPHPEKSEGIFIVAQRAREKGYFYSIEGELLSFEERAR
ncbi:MAG: hypothetical protein KDD64_10795 [Bdellovibrionales bacterium]|nr:hypothetical protein [Bdellovibrionales bacterium]